MPGENRCVCCGTIIPEGLQVCPNCESGGSRMDAKGKPEKTIIRNAIMHKDGQRFLSGYRHGNAYWTYDIYEACRVGIPELVKMIAEKTGGKLVEVRIEIRETQELAEEQT